MNYLENTTFGSSMIVTGTATGHDSNLIIEWTCPYSGKLLSCQGVEEFWWDENGYYHEVRDRHTDELLYTVIA